jgi:Zn-dependent M28 family amino/carboxypeptidase
VAGRITTISAWREPRQRHRRSHHPSGADDNASGTAGLNWHAGRRKTLQTKRQARILFLTFAGEELGLLGSEWYVNHPTYPLEKAVAMINMDMIGPASATGKFS